ncbi:MAG TPA: methyltransferase domain-containing protein [Bryobacteraceae bacterium]|nr:methyltransferase domain-containing protein [Bryobacteraceae bacterium]
MRHLCLCLLALSSLRAGSSADLQALTEKLFPHTERLKEMRIPEIVAALRIGSGSVVADVGCGGGEYSVLLAGVVGNAGRVYCEDISDDKQWGLPAARRLVAKRHTRNITILRGGSDDPTLAVGSLDAVLIVNAYHEMPQYRSMLRHIRESLRPGGRLVIVDNRPQRTADRPREKQTGNHVLSVDLAAAELSEAGFHISDRRDSFIDNPDSESAHWLLAADKAGTAP